MSDTLREGFYKLGIGDAATVVVGERLYCVGGFRVEYDEDLKLFYQSPQVRAGSFLFGANTGFETSCGHPYMTSALSRGGG